MAEKSDIELINLALHHKDEQAYSDIYNRFYDRLYLLIYGYVKDEDVAEDLLIEVFTKVFSKLNQYQPESSFLSWLNVVARNHTLDHLRKQKQYFVRLGQDDDEHPSLEIADDKMSALDGIILKERNERLKGMVDSLKPKYKKLVKLRYFDQLSYDEIAVELNLPLGTVKAQLHRARELLAQIVKNHPHLE